MALINRVANTASIVFGGNTINSNTVETLLTLAPTIVKAVDKPVAQIGDTLTYTVTVTNVALTAVTNVTFSDIVAAGATYIADSFKVNGTAQTPTIAGTTLSYTIPSIAALGNSVITFQVKIVGGS